jgi:hypothetical protein
MNADKTEAMIMEGGNVSQPMSKDAYHHCRTGQGKSWSEKSGEQLMWCSSQSMWNNSTSINKEMHQQ